MLKTMISSAFKRFKFRKKPKSESENLPAKPKGTPSDQATETKQDLRHPQYTSAFRQNVGLNVASKKATATASKLSQTQGPPAVPNSVVSHAEFAEQNAILPGNDDLSSGRDRLLNGDDMDSSNHGAFAKPERNNTGSAQEDTQLSQGISFSHSAERSHDGNASNAPPTSNTFKYRRLHQIPSENPIINIQSPSRTATLVGDMISANVNARLLQQPPHLLNVEIPKRSRSYSASRFAPSPRQRDPPPLITENDMTNPIFPKTISVKVCFTFRGIKNSFDDREFHDFDWTDCKNYDELIPTKIVQKLREVYALETEYMYPRHGSCRVKGPDWLRYDGHYSILDDIEVLSQKAIVNICGFISVHPMTQLSLEVYWDYGSAQLEPLPRTGYSEMIQRELEKKIKTNFLPLPYIPRRDLDVFLVFEVIERIVHEDTSLNLDKTSRDEFVRRIIEGDAVKLFTICVYSHLPMRFLRHLIDVHKCSDDPENHPKWDTSVNCDEDCRLKTKKLIDCIPIFFVRNVKRDYRHRKIGDHDVLPLHHTGPESPEGVKEISLLGESEGAVGKVYKVTIDPAHHYLSGVRQCPCYENSPAD
jgi:hypothetical protein